jgi:hypothetical protein
LRGELEKLAARQWRHPSTGEPVQCNRQPGGVLADAFVF